MRVVAELFTVAQLRSRMQEADKRMEALIAMCREGRCSGLCRGLGEGRQ